MCSDVLSCGAPVCNNLSVIATDRMAFDNDLNCSPSIAFLPEHAADYSVPANVKPSNCSSQFSCRCWADFKAKAGPDEPTNLERTFAALTFDVGSQSLQRNFHDQPEPWAYYFHTTRNRALLFCCCETTSL